MYFYFVCVITDKGYVGTDADNIAAIERKSSDRRKAFAKKFWSALSSGRSKIERDFSSFFVHKFKQLSMF